MKSHRSSSHQNSPASPSIEVLESRIAPARAFAVLGGSLVSFDTATPGTVPLNIPITGLSVFETIEGIDFRPSTGELYALTSDAFSTGRIYTLNTSTGAATLVSTVSVPLSGNDFGVDFNPVVDRLRVVSDLDQNLRINVDTGLATIDLSLNPGNPNVVASAYSNSFAGATATTLYGIDTVTDSLVIQNPPNNGTLTAVGAGLGVNSSNFAAFDISTSGLSSSPTNTGFAVLTVAGVHNLYSIDLVSGAAALVGAIPGAGVVRGFSLAPAGTIRIGDPSYTINEGGGLVTVLVERVGGTFGTVSTQFVTANGTASAGSDYQSQSITLTFLDGAVRTQLAIPITDDPSAEDIEAFRVMLQNPTGGVVTIATPSSVVIADNEVVPGAGFALDTSNNLLRFNTAHPDQILTSTPLTGLQVGELVLGFDFRPSDGKLYAVTNSGNGKLYTIDITTGVATPLFSLTADPTDLTNPFTTLSGGQFGVDFNPVADRLRIVSDSNQNLRVNVDTGTVITDGDINPNTVHPVSSAYTNSFPGSTSTTLFAIDQLADTLFIQNPPNNGTMVTVGSLGVDATGLGSFDIRSQGGVNLGLATFQVGGITSLYSINTSSGAATFLGPVGAGTTSLLAFSVAPTQFVATVSGATSTFTGSNFSDAIVIDQAGGLLRHNRFTAGDGGFNSDFDFDSTVDGDQTLSASAASTIIVNGGNGSDNLAIGSSATSQLGGANFELHGGSGTDRLRIAADAGAGNILVEGGAGDDVIDFSASGSGVTFTFDAINAPAALNNTSVRLILAEQIENFVGTAFNDTIVVTGGFFTHQVDGGGQTSPDGDKLFFDAKGTPVSITRTLANAGSIVPEAFVAIPFDNVETVRILNSPSSTFGGLGNPASAFAAGSIDDLAPAKSPVAVASGDLNGDGFADLITVNAKSKNISVLLNHGDGTFESPSVFATVGKKPSDLVVSDFNGDSFLDVVVINSGSASLSFFKGNGDGSLSDAAVTKIAAKPTAVAAGRLNGDLLSDLVIVHSSGAVSVLLGNGTGFDTPTSFKTGGKGTSDVALGDFNNDTFLDVVAANSKSNNLSFLGGDGTGALSTASQFATGVKPTSLAIADLDLDGSLDVAVVNGVSRFVSVLYGRGAAIGEQFDPQQRIGLPKAVRPASIAIGDISGDGFADIVLASTSGASVHTLLGLGTRHYAAPLNFDLGDESKPSTVAGLTLTDLNNDGLLDIATTVSNANELRTLLRQPPA